LPGSGMIEDSIHLGDSPAKIRKKFGQPNTDEPDENTETMTYEDSHAQWKDVSFYNAELFFRNNRLVRITLRNGK
jgi:hypothetical protein